MDRLRKCLQKYRFKVRKFVDRNWHNRPEGDIFRSLDFLLIIGAVRYKPLQKWQRICWNMYCVLSVCSFSIMVLELIDEISGKLDLVKVTWHASLTLATSLCFMKDFLLRQHFESIQTAKTFINSKPFESGDRVNDAACRGKFFQRLQLVALGILTNVVMNQTIFMVPNSRINELYGIPRILRCLGLSAAKEIHFLFLLTFCPLWINKYLVGTVTICSVQYGFKMEYDIFVRGFENILDNVYLDVDEKLSKATLKAAPEWKRYQRDKLYWKHLKQHVTSQIKQHVQLVENMQLMQPVVKHLFGIMYYNAMVIFAPFIYIVLTNGLSITTIVVLSGTALNMLECYGWCSIIESHKDINDDLEMEIMNLITKIPYSKVHHREYVDIQTTLRIMKTFVRNNQLYSCGGVFPITVEAFTDLLNVGYTVFTFLKDMGKKN